jgi:hypothetical protein
VVLVTVAISAAEAAASASAAAAAAVVAINEAVYCLIKGRWLPGACRDIRSEDDRRITLSSGPYQVGLIKGLDWLSLVQEHAGDCGFSYEAEPAGFQFEGGSGGRGQVWSPALRLRGVSEATALRALFKCDFSVRAACREFGGDQTLCWNVRKALKDFPEYEVRDMEVAGAELEGLVRVFVERAKCQVMEKKELHKESMEEARLDGKWVRRNGMYWSVTAQENYCAGSVFNGLPSMVALAEARSVRTFRRAVASVDGASCGFSHDAL